MLDFDINELKNDVAMIERQQDLKADLLDNEKARLLRIKTFYRNQRAIARWGIQVDTTERYKPINEAHIIQSIDNRSISGYGLISDVFISHCLMTFESRLKAQCIKVKGLQVTNLNKVKRTLKSLKGRKSDLTKVYQSISEDESIKFIDKTLSLRFIVKKLIEGLTIIINKGYEYKHSKRYVSLCADNAETNYQTFYDAVRGLNDLKPAGIYKQANHKMKVRQIKQLNYMPIITYKGDKMDKIEFYSRKQLPLYLQD